MDIILKRGKMDHHVQSDRLSDLPLEIIHRILALIPIRNVVRTSVLSTQWRYTWTTLPQLVFDEDWLNQENLTVSKSEFVARVLDRHRGPIHKFKLHFSGGFPIVDEWIFCLSRNGIQELVLDYNYDKQSLFETRSSIYLLKKLTYLRLYGCVLDPPPLTFKGFFFLRCLRLSMFSLSPGEIYKLVAVCPHLEGLELIDTEENFELKISAPNLKYTSLHGYHEIICINAPLMTEISVDLCYYNIIESPDKDLEISSCDYVKCFGGFTNLQKLFGSSYFTEYLSLGIELSHHSLVFHHLKLIHLDFVNFEDVKEVMVVAHLLIGAPNLQELELSCRSREYDVSDSEASQLSFKDLGCASNFKLERLSHVSLYYANGFTLGVEFLKFVLESSPALETMRVGLFYDTEEEQINLRTKLEECNWASPTVKLSTVFSGSHRIRPATLYNKVRLPFSLCDCW